MRRRLLHNTKENHKHSQKTKKLMNQALYEAIMLLKESREQFLRQKFVDREVVDDKQFKQILDTDPSNNYKYSAWLLTRYQKDIKPKGDNSREVKLFWEDLYKFEGYLELFDRLKQKFPKKDINQYKSLSEFQQDVIEIKEKYSQEDPSQLEKGLDKGEKYSELKLGEVDGFIIYEIPQGSKNLKQVACDLGSGTEWCTAHSGATYFESYIKDGPLFIIINKSDPKEKYQFHFESGQFMDSNDQSILSF